MIFAAGKGTRLAPYTNNTPKALVKVNGKPMLEHIIRKVIDAGFSDLVINIHHFGEQIVDFLEKNNRFGVSIQISDETDLLLETGGGLLKAQSLLNDGEPFLVHNVDIISNLDIKSLYSNHLKNKSLATLAVKNRPTSRSLLINPLGELAGWKNNQTHEIRISKGKEADLTPVAFSGVHVISPEIFPLITETGAFSIIDTYLRLAQTHPICTWNQGDTLWMDVGRTEHLAQAEKYMKDNGM
jgi:N-acetyl-alpha-D-muramate 1-phosphate uridylyltransferase